MDLRTERLAMRQPSEGDVEELVALHADPLIERVFGAMTRDEVVEWVAHARREWDERGHGRVLLFDREDGAFLGRSGLRHWPGVGEVEVRT